MQFVDLAEIRARPGADGQEPVAPGLQARVGAGALIRGLAIAAKAADGHVERLGSGGKGQEGDGARDSGQGKSTQHGSSLWLGGNRHSLP